MNAMHDSADCGAPERLARVDLNLLVAFDALSRERHVTRAARRLGITQSAMSHALGRLRELLNDPLFVRGRGGMALTPRAEELIVPLRAGLVAFGRALSQPGEFVPASAKRTFFIASPDLFDVLVMPPLLERIRRLAPWIDLVIVPLDERRLPDALQTGEVDVGIVPQLDGAESEQPRTSVQGLSRLRLFHDRFVCLLRADHPSLRRRGKRRVSSGGQLPLRTFVELSHVLVSPTGEGGGFVDHLLEARGLGRRVALRIPHFYSALAIVARSDLVVTAPNALAHLITPEHGVVALRAPLALPEHDVHLVWHERYSKDAGHVWLRGVIKEVARGLQRRL